MLAKVFAIAAIPVLAAAQDKADLKRAALLERIDSDIAASYAKHAVEAPEIVEALQRVALRLGAGTLNFRLTRNATSEADEPFPPAEGSLLPKSSCGE